MDEKDSTIKMLKAQLSLYKKLYDNAKTEIRYREYNTEQLSNTINTSYKWESSGDTKTAVIKLSEKVFTDLYNGLRDGHQHGRNMQELREQNKVIQDTLKLIE